jgi:hypothetical protein
VTSPIAYPPQQRNDLHVVFVSIAVINSGTFKGLREIGALEKSVKEDLERYVALAQSQGHPASYRMKTGTDVVESGVEVCLELVREFPQATIFMGQRTFELEKFYYRLLHNDTPFAIQRRLEWAGIPTVILPITLRLGRGRKEMATPTS